MLSVCSTRRGARRGEVQLHVAAEFHANMPTRPRPNPQIVEHAAEPAGALGPLAVRRPLGARWAWPIRSACPEQPLRALEGMHERERVGLHQALHGSPSLGPASLSPRPVTPADTDRAPAQDDIQPTKNETLDRFLTGPIAGPPIIGLFFVAWQISADLLFWSDLIVFAIIYVDDRARHHRRLPPAADPPRL